MRSSLSIFGFLSLALALHAGQTTFSATPSTLAGWSVTGAELSAVLGQADLTVPANAQLLRSCRATEVSLVLLTQPVLGEKAESWPVLELGDAALVLVRSGSTGRLVLVLGEQAPRDLPVTFALDEKGRSVEVLAFGFSRDGDTVSVTTAGQVLKFPAGFVSADQSLPMVVSAGADVPWVFQRLAATLVSDDPVAERKGAVTPSAEVPLLSDDKYHASAPPLFGGRVTSSSAIPKVFPFAGGSAKAATPAAISNRNTLEIYTPSAVRTGRLKAIRAAAQSRTQN